MKRCARCFALENRKLCERFGKTTKLEERCIRRRLVRERFGETARRKERCIRLRLGSKKRRRIGERCKFRLVLYATPAAKAVSARLVSPSTKGGEPFVAGARPVITEIRKKCQLLLITLSNLSRSENFSTTAELAGTRLRRRKRLQTQY